jgi:plastocyanin
MKRKSPSIRRWLVLATLTTFAFALCVVGAGSQQAKTVTVTITPGTPPTVSPDPAEISKSAGDQVDWVCPDCTSGFAVHFPQGTPFSSSSFSQGNPQSGAAAAYAKMQTYHYTVTVNGNSTDPGVKVNP